MVQGFKQKQGKPTKAAHMARKNAAKQRKNKDHFSKSSHKLSTVSPLENLIKLQEINRNIEEQMLGRAQVNKVSLSVVKSQAQMKLEAKKAKQHQKALHAKVQKLMGDDQ